MATDSSTKFQRTHTWMTYACVFLFISLYSCPSHLGILEIFPHYPIPCHFILYKCCTVSQCMNIRNYFNQSPCGRWTPRCFCTQCYSEHPCINTSLHYFDYVCHLRVWQSSFKEALLYQYSLFQPSSVEHLLWSLSWAPGCDVQVRRPKQLCLRRRSCFSVIYHTPSVCCVLGALQNLLHSVAHSVDQQSHEVVIIYPHLAEEECQAQRCQLPFLE